MGRPTERDLDHLARETGYDGLSLEKMIRLFGILQAIGRDGFLGGRLALKGGTALNAFHLRLKRLSLDIDFNHLNPLSDDMWLSERKEVDAAVSRIVRGQGYKPSGPRVRGPRSRWDLPFASALGQDETLHIDLGYADCRPLFGASRMSSAKVGGWGATDILVLSLEDVIAGKLAALTRRTLSRDLFDARSILSMEGLDWRASGPRLSRPSRALLISGGAATFGVGATASKHAKACYPACLGSVSATTPRRWSGTTKALRTARRNSGAWWRRPRARSGFSTTSRSTAWSTPAFSMRRTGFAPASPPRRGSPGGARRRWMMRGRRRRFPWPDPRPDRRWGSDAVLRSALAVRRTQNGFSHVYMTHEKVFILYR